MIIVAIFLLVLCLGCCTLLPSCVDKLQVKRGKSGLGNFLSRKGKEYKVKVQ